MNSTQRMKTGERPVFTPSRFLRESTLQTLAGLGQLQRVKPNS